MRYVVTGAAGFIGSHLAEALVAAGHEVVGIDCFTDYYDPALKEENARGLDVRDASTSPRTSSTSPASTASSTSPAQPGVRSFGDVFPLYLRRNVLASQRVFEAAARDGVKVVFASSSSVYGAAERYPTPEDTPPRPLSPYGITKLACEHLADAYARAVRPRLRRRCATSTRSARGSGPTWRSRGSSTRSRRAARFELYGDGDQSRELDVRRRRRRRRRSRRWSAGRARTTSAARSRRR